ncbi:MAG: Lrp/AsnC family transcriptional regulator [Proteobacteria bacterium]|nr:Lrp/AsnC family transcriptional regulator [Pseudomonadota bacterium]
MVTAVVLIEAETDKINTLAETLVEMNGIKEVFSVAGRYDLIAIVRVQSNEDVADVVSDSMRHLAGIVKTETMIAFRVYTREDVEGMFSA